MNRVCQKLPVGDLLKSFNLKSKSECKDAAQKKITRNLQNLGKKTSFNLTSLKIWTTT